MVRRVVLLLVAAALAASCSKPVSRDAAVGPNPQAPPLPEDGAARPPGAQAYVALGGSPVRVGGSVGDQPPAQRSEPPGEQSPARSESEIPVPQDRKLIRNANASLEVKSVDEAIAKIRALAQGAGGYVTNEGRSRDEHGVGRATVVARVPAAKLDSVTGGLRSLGTIERFWVSATDITEEYFNLQLRLRNQRMLEARLLELLNRPGNKLSDLLETERELARVRSEIDQLEGRQRFWDNRVSLSTVTVDMHEPQPAVAGAEGGAWAALKRSFSQAADNFVFAVAGIIAVSGGLIPVVVVLAAVLALLVRWWRWRRRRRAARAAGASA